MLVKWRTPRTWRLQRFGNDLRAARTGKLSKTDQKSSCVCLYDRHQSGSTSLYDWPPQILDAIVCQSARIRPVKAQIFRALVQEPHFVPVVYHFSSSFKGSVITEFCETSNVDRVFWAPLPSQSRVISFMC